MPKLSLDWEEPPVTEPEPRNDRCGNCDSLLGEGDRYCKYCGTERGLGNYVPSMSGMECIYGPPPIERTHKCEKCGNIFTVFAMVDSGKYCPRCGGRTVIIAEDNPWLREKRK